MKLDDIRISRGIIERYSQKLIDVLDSDIAIVGGGPAGLTAAYYLAKAQKKVVLFERKLSIGGGMWGGGIMFNEIVVQEAGKSVLDEFDIRSHSIGDGYYTVDSVEAVTTLCSKACQAGARIMNLFSVEDVKITEKRIDGLVINWSAVGMANLHIDPITVRAKYIIDSTGHPAEVAKIIQNKASVALLTETGKIMGERPMCADIAERFVLEYTREFYPCVYAAGMSCNAIFGGFRMGPIFGGMLLSGKRAAELIVDRLKS